MSIGRDFYTHLINTNQFPPQMSQQDLFELITLIAISYLWKDRPKNLAAFFDEIAQDVSTYFAYKEEIDHVQSL